MVRGADENEMHQEKWVAGSARRTTITSTKPASARYAARIGLDRVSYEELRSGFSPGEALIPAEPGLFRTAFCRGNGRGAAPADPADSPPRRLFREAVEELASYEPTAQCPYPELVCWSAVHGLAVLLVDGRLGPLPPAQCTTLVEAVVDAVRPGPGRPGT